MNKAADPENEIAYYYFFSRSHRYIHTSSCSPVLPCCLLSISTRKKERSTENSSRINTVKNNGEKLFHLSPLLQEQPAPHNECIHSSAQYPSGDEKENEDLAYEFVG